MFIPHPLIIQKSGTNVLSRLAADQGFPVAMFAVGDCFYLGSGVEQNLESAREWYRKALDAGYEPDEEDRKHLDDENSLAPARLFIDVVLYLQYRSVCAICALHSGQFAYQVW